MKRLSVPPLAVVCLAVVACLAGQAGAADWANPVNYGYGAGGPGYAGYTGTANFAPEMTGYGGPSFASYPQNGYAAYNYPGYGYGGGYGYSSYGYGGYGYGCGGNGCGAGGGRRRHCCGHCCSWGTNSVCCGDSWNGYTPSSYGQGVKVHRRHRALGCGAGPCVDGSCSNLSAGYATNCGRFHRCHLRRNRNMGYAAAYGCSDCDGGTVVDQAPAQPSMSGPAPTESLQTPIPSAVEPPSPGDDSAT